MKLMENWSAKGDKIKEDGVFFKMDFYFFKGEVGKEEQAQKNFITLPL